MAQQMGACRIGGGSPEAGVKKFSFSRLSRLREFSSFEDKWSLEAQMAGGRTISGKENGGRRKGRGARHRRGAILS